MPRYFFTYQQIIEAPSHEEAAIKGLTALADDFTNPYTEISLSTDDLSFHYNDIYNPVNKHMNHIVGITKDSRGRRTFTIVTDEDGNSSK